MICCDWSGFFSTILFGGLIAVSLLTVLVLVILRTLNTKSGKNYFKYARAAVVPLVFGIIGIILIGLNQKIAEVFDKGGTICFIIFSILLAFYICIKDKL